jgi:hypothetical protein
VGVELPQSVLAEIAEIAGCRFQNFLSLPMSNPRNLIQGQARFSHYNDVQECPLGCEASGALRKALETGKTTNVTNGKI